MAYDHEIHWPQIKDLAEAGKYQELHNLIEQISDLKERVALYRFAVRGLMFRPWNGKNLAPLISLGDAGIEASLKNYQLHPEDLSLKDEANIICYNMSANLAGCWNDGFIRTEEHFRKGLQYAERALKFRRELKKGPWPFSIAYWAKGTHEMFLKNFTEAEKSYQESLGYAEEIARTGNLPTTPVKEAPFAVLVALGYLALVQLAQKKTGGEELYNRVLSALEEMKTISEEAKEDAEIGLNQLRNVRANKSLLNT